MGAHKDSHRKWPDDPEVPGIVTQLKETWKSLTASQRSELITLLEQKQCSLRGIADAIGKDDGTIRNYRKLQELSEGQRERVAAGAPITTTLHESDLPRFRARGRERVQQDEQDGSASNILADRICWFMMTYLTGWCATPYLNQLFWNVERQIYFRLQPILRDPNLRRAPFPVSPDYSLPHIIRRSRPFVPDKTDREYLSDLNYASQWLEDVVIRLEPERTIRDAGFDKARDMLRRGATNLEESLQRAAHCNPKKLGQYLRQLRFPANYRPGDWT